MDKILSTELGPIVAVETSEDQVILYFISHKLRCEAVGDCCSYSYLRYYDDMNKAVGRELKDIKSMSLDVSNDTPDYKESDRNNYYRYHRYTFTFKDDTSISLELVNESNGYYDGYIYYHLESN